jgi:hypothetical protein
VAFDASTSTVAGGGASYTFDFGDGTLAGPQASPLASHEYAAGTWVARVHVFDAAGASDQATATAQALQNLVGNPSFETSLNGWNASGDATLTRVAGGLDGNWSLEMQGPPGILGSFGVNDTPSWVSEVAAAGLRYRFSAWVRSESANGDAKIRVREYLGGIQQGPTVSSPEVTLSPAWRELTVDYTTLVAGGALDFQVVETPDVAGEVFQTDRISIIRVPSGSLALQELERGPDESIPVTDPLAVRFAPNPLRSTSILRFTTAVSGAARVDVYDVHGRRMATPLDARLSAGVHDVAVPGPGSRLDAGIYFYRLLTVGGTRTGRFVVLER